MPRHQGPVMTTHLAKPADLIGFVGREVGTTDWIEVTQQQVNLLAEASGDHR